MACLRVPRAGWKERQPHWVSLRKVVARTPLHQVDGAGRKHLAEWSAPCALLCQTVVILRVLTGQVDGRRSSARGLCIVGFS